MKGYLSRLANQSGLRFSSKGVGSPRRTSMLHAGPRPKPLDREETVTVPPPVDSKRSEGGVLMDSSTSKRPAPENFALKPDRKNAMTLPDPAPPLAPSAPSPTVSPVGETKFVLVTPEPESSPKKNDISLDESPVSNASGSAPAELVQSVSIKPSTTSGKPEKPSSETSSAGFAEPDAPEIKPHKHYFSRTEEILDGRVAEPLEVQTILLGEIQEWAAAGNESEAAEETAAGRSVEIAAFSTETSQTQAVVPMTEPESGVVRIGERRQPASVPQETARIDEQRFDLSIGTINVVVAGDQHPPQPAPAMSADNRQNRLDTGRRRSRLHRNYL